MNILLIEDEPDFVDLVRKILGKKGFKLRTAGTTADGIRTIAERRPDLVLLDLKLPDGDGLEVLRRVRAAGAAQRVPILILSTKDQDADIAEGLDLGADDYLVKDFTPRELLARVERLLQRSRNSIGRRAAALLLGLILGAGAPLTAGADEQSDHASRIAADLSGFLDGTLGPGRAKVIVSVRGGRRQSEVQTETYEMDRSPAPKGLTEKEDWLGRDLSADSSVLPGYTSKENKPAPPPIQTGRRTEKYISTPHFVISDIRVTVFLDETIAQEAADKLETHLKDIAGLEADRDVLAIERVALPDWEGLKTAQRFKNDSIRLGVASAVLLLFAGLAYLLANRLVSKFTENLKSLHPTTPQLEYAVSPEQQRLEAGIPAGNVPAAAAENVLVTTAEEVESGWDFLEGLSPESAVALLSEEGPRSLAALMVHLNSTHPSLSVQLFAGLSDARKLEVSREMAGLTRIDPEQIFEIEGRIRDRMSTGVRGTEQLGRLLSGIPPEQREFVLQEFRHRHPESIAELERNLMTFEHVAGLPPEELVRLLGAVPLTTWALALREMPSELVGAVLAQVPADEGARMRQTLDTPQPMRRVLDARAEILACAHDLGRKGEIAI